MIGVALTLYVVIGIIILVTRTLIAVWMYEDARKYGLNSMMCALMVIILPLVISILLYGLMKYGKKEVVYCSQCKSIASKVDMYCAVCRNKFKSECPKCKHIIERKDNYCSLCGEKNIEYIEVNKKANHKARVYAVVISIQIGLILVVIGMYSALSLMQERINEKVIQRQMEARADIAVGNHNVQNGVNDKLNEMGEILQKKTGKESGVLKIPKGENTIQSQLNVKEGRAEVTIKRENGEVVFNKEYEEAQIDNIVIESKKEEVLDITIIFDKYKGNFKISLIE